MLSGVLVSRSILLCSAARLDEDDDEAVVDAVASTLLRLGVAGCIAEEWVFVVSRSRSEASIDVSGSLVGACVGEERDVALFCSSDGFD